MKDHLTAEERRKIQDITEMFAKNWNKLKNEKLNPNHTLTFSGEVKFSDDDTGNDSDFAEERAEAALFEIKKEVIKHELQPSLTAYLNARNAQIRQGKKNKLEKAKEIIASRFGFRKHAEK